jgi:hypothetical protein
VESRISIVQFSSLNIRDFTNRTFEDATKKGIKLDLFDRLENNAIGSFVIDLSKVVDGPTQRFCEDITIGKVTCVLNFSTKFLVRFILLMCRRPKLSLPDWRVLFCTRRIAVRN